MKWAKVRAAAYVALLIKFRVFYMVEMKNHFLYRLVHKDLLKALENEAFYSHILTIKIDGK